jgi:hypothetical protein
LHKANSQVILDQYCPSKPKKFSPNWVGRKEKVIAHGKAHLVEIQEELVRVKNTSGKRHI